jgi:hypothetical protein
MQVLLWSFWQNEAELSPGQVKLTRKDSCFGVPNGSPKRPIEQLVPNCLRKIITPHVIEEYEKLYKIKNQKFMAIE